MMYLLILILNLIVAGYISELESQTPKFNRHKNALLGGWPFNVTLLVSVLVVYLGDITQAEHFFDASALLFVIYVGNVERSKLTITLK